MTYDNDESLWEAEEALSEAEFAKGIRERMSQPRLKLPIWVALQRTLSGAGPRKFNFEPAFEAAFSSPDHIAWLLRSQSNEGWHLHAIKTLQCLMFLVADLRRENAFGICVDPAADGSGGNKYSIVEMLDLIADELS